MEKTIFSLYYFYRRFHVWFLAEHDKRNYRCSKLFIFLFTDLLSWYHQINFRKKDWTFWWILKSETIKISRKRRRLFCVDNFLTYLCLDLRHSFHPSLNFQLGKWQWRKCCHLCYFRLSNEFFLCLLCWIIFKLADNKEHRLSANTQNFFLSCFL